MSLAEFARNIPGLAGLPHAEKIKLFSWFLHEKRNQQTLRVADIRSCYSELHFDLPGNLARSIDALTEKRPPELLKQQSSYRLHANVRTEFERRFGKPQSNITVEAALASLPGKIADESERQFLEEVLVCYRYRAFRGAIVMAWNLAYDHLVRWILADVGRLSTFNQAIGKRNPKKAHIVIVRREDFEDLKEDEVIDIAANLPEITANVKRVLKEKLGRRNTYAHPSTLIIAQPQVDDMVTDLVNNVVLRLTWRRF